MVALGVTAHPPGTGADAVRSAEAADVAAAVRTALAERWQVFDQPDRRWRDVELGDIAVLVPARTSLPHLEEALERGGIPYRAEASSLVYRTSEVRDRIVRDRRMLEVAGQVRSDAGSRTRDVWRRLRFVIDHARAWSESERGGLRGYLAWAARQGDESSRVAEAILPETDDDAVRIMTIHAAKSLEFPVVIVSGLSSRPLTSRGVEVLWPATGGYALKVGATMQTGDFEVAKPIDEQMGHHERIRLLYVAATRARDHLVVCLRLPNLHDEWNGLGAAAAALAAGAVLEGYIDLLYRQDDGSLVIVDYKTDAVPAAAVPGRVAHYRPQMQAYALALTEALGEPVSQAVLLFLHPQGAFEESVSLSVPLAFS